MTNQIQHERVNDEVSNPTNPNFPVVPGVALILLFLWGVGLKARDTPPEVWFILSLLVPVVAYLNYKLVFFKGTRVTLSGMIVIVTAIAVAMGFVRFSRELRAEYTYEGHMKVINPEGDKSFQKVWEQTTPFIEGLFEQHRTSAPQKFFMFNNPFVRIDKADVDGVVVQWTTFKTPDGITPGLAFSVTGHHFNYQKQWKKMEALMDAFERQLPEIEFAEKRIWLHTAEGPQELTKHNAVESPIVESDSTEKRHR